MIQFQMTGTLNVSLKFEKLGTTAHSFHLIENIPKD